MTISRHLTPKQRATLRADIARLQNAHDVRLWAHWKSYFINVRLAERRARAASSESAKRRHLNDAAKCLALAIAARKRAR